MRSPARFSVPCVSPPTSFTRRRVGSEIALLSHPATPGTQGTHLQIDRTDGFVLRMLQLVAVANEGNRGEGQEGQRSALFLLASGEKTSDCLGVFVDGASRAIFFLQGVVPRFKQRLADPQVPVGFESGDRLVHGVLLTQIFPAVQTACLFS
ncbi:MAG: hypothetical protein ACJ8AG_15515 [Ktedonobacteraceae bacterium]